jgi:hypothetical protein
METTLAPEVELLLLGWGFNFYRVENQLRADDLLLRQKAGDFLGRAAAKLEKLAADFQRDCMASTTSDQRYPSAALMGRLNALRSLRRRVGEQSAFLQGCPAPAQDKIWRRLRSEEGLLRALLQTDADLIHVAGDIERLTNSLRAESCNSPDALQPLAALLDRWDETVRARQDLLHIRF